MIEAWARIATAIILGLLWALWARELHRSNKARRKECEISEKVVERLDAGTLQLMNAGLQLTAVRHMHYHVDDEVVPGMIMVTCQDCKEPVGTIQHEDDMYQMVMKHVQDKFEEIGRTVRAAEASVESE